MVQCPECKLNLDGWEPNDNAVTEHISRSFTCVIAGKLKQRADTSRNLKNESTKATQIKNKSKHAKLQADLLAFEAENLEESQHGIIEETSSATLQSDQKSTAKVISQEPSLLPTIEEKGGSPVVKAEQSLLQEKPDEALSLDLEDWVEFGFEGEEIDGWIEI